MFPVKGNSMAPLIHNEGDLLIVKRDIAELQRGDILLYQDGEQLLAHRLLRIFYNENGSVSYLTKGDRSNIPDPWVKSEQVAGRVIAIRRGDSVMTLDSKGWKWASKAVSRAMSGWISLFPSAARVSKDMGSKKSAISVKIINRVSSVVFSSLLWLVQAILGNWEKVT